MTARIIRLPGVDARQRLGAASAQIVQLGEHMARANARRKIAPPAEQPAQTDERQAFARRLAKIMKRRGLLAADLSAAAGIGPDVLSKILAAKRLPSRATAEKLAPALGTTARELLSPGSAVPDICDFRLGPDGRHGRLIIDADMTATDAARFVALFGETRR